MLDAFHILTLTHKQAKLSLLEHFVLQGVEGDDKRDFLANLAQQFGIKEIMYLATCNRVVYFFYKDDPAEISLVSDFMDAVNPQLSFDLKEELLPLVQHHRGLDAIRHLFEVSASIDSMVVGEREILRQVREAYEQCRQWALTGDNIRVAMRQVVQATKEVYAQTRIGEKPVSVVSLAVQEMLAADVSRNARILMIGAGQTNTLVGKFLVKLGFSKVTVYNRTLGRALELADKFEGEGLPLSMLPRHNEGFDCLIVCTGATQAIVDADLYQKLLVGETDQKVVIDLAIPNNVSKEVVEKFPINYIEIEGLRHLAGKNIDFRLKEVAKA